MLASELRLGNRVNFYVENLKETYGGGLITSVNPTHVELNEIRIPIGALVPIDLTEEWLIKFGLTKLSPVRFLLGGYELSYCLNQKSWKVILRGGVLARLQYVHQLQNFYFALTGKELTWQNTDN